MKKPLFVFIVDSYDEGGLAQVLDALGLEQDVTYYVTGAGGAWFILWGDVGSRIVDSEKLLVFLSTFRGYFEPAVALAKEIRRVNPHAKIIYRSTYTGYSDPVFDKAISKESRHAHDSQVEEIVKEFLSDVSVT